MSFRTSRMSHRIGMIYGETPKPGFTGEIDKLGNPIRHAQLATNNHWYHPTKGWRKNRPNTELGYHKIYTFLNRLFQVETKEKENV